MPHEPPSFPPPIPHSSTQDLPQTIAELAREMENPLFGFYFDFDSGSLPGLLPDSSEIDFDSLCGDMFNSAAPADAPEDRRSTDPDMPGVNLVNGAAASFGIQYHLEEGEDAQRQFDSEKQSDVELQRLVGEVEPSSLTAPGENMVVEAAAAATATEDGRPSGGDADMPEVNAATQPSPGSLPLVLGQEYAAAPHTCATGEHVDDESAELNLWRSALEQDLADSGWGPSWRKLIIAAFLLEKSRSPENGQLPGPTDVISMDTPSWSIVPFTGPDPKDTNPNKAGWNWKETSMKGMRRAVADASLTQPPGQQQQHYVGLKKTLELHDDDDGNGNGNKWGAHEYTPLLPSDDGTNKLVPADASLRLVFKEDKPPQSSKRSRSGAKIPPSEVWDHMTRLHEKVIPTDGSQKKKNPDYLVKYAICHHCDKVFNAESKNCGTHNLLIHLKRCNCNCTHSHHLQPVDSKLYQRVEPKDPKRAKIGAGSDCIC